MNKKDKQTSPLELMKHFFPLVNIRTKELEPEDAAKDVPFGYELRTKTELRGAADDPLLYKVSMTITSHPKEGALFGYEIEVVAVGFVHVSPEKSEKERPRLAAVLGGSLLYSAAREFIYGLTARGPYPGVYLPTANFTSSAPDEPEISAPPSPEKPKKPARKRKPAPAAK